MIYSMPWGLLRFPWDPTEYEKEAWPWVVCPESGIAIDVGAHQGFYSVKMAKESEGADDARHGFSNVKDALEWLHSPIVVGKVIAFEPEPQNLMVLCYNLGLNHVINAQIACLALSDYEGVGTFVAYRPEVEKDSAKHFVRGSCVDEPYGREPSRDIPPPEVERKVTVSTLDSWIKEFPQPRVDVIKVDTEGAEVKVIRGAYETIGKFGPRVCVEVHYRQYGEISVLFRALGYRLVKYIDRMTGSGNDMAVFEPNIRPDNVKGG